jgi:hypothetical protein
MEGTPALQGCSDLSCPQQQEGREEYIDIIFQASEQVRSIATYVTGVQQVHI